MKLIYINLYINLINRKEEVINMGLEDLINLMITSDLSIFNGKDD